MGLTGHMSVHYEYIYLYMLYVAMRHQTWHTCDMCSYVTQILSSHHFTSYPLQLMFKVKVFFTIDDTYKKTNLKKFLFIRLPNYEQSKVTILSKLSVVWGRCVWASVSMSNTISSQHWTRIIVQIDTINRH